MKTEISLVKVLKKDIPYKTVMIPVSDQDVEIFKKFDIGRPEYFSVKQKRKIEKHRFLFRVFVIALENGILEKMVTKGIITQEVLDFHREWMKNDTDVLLYFCKWFLLPLEKRIMPDGSVRMEVSSISFGKMNEFNFLEFRDGKVVPWIADILEIDQFLLRDMAKYETEAKA